MPTIKSDGALALVQRSGLLEDLHEEYVTDTDAGLTAISTMHRRDQPTAISTRFSLAMAEQAGLTQQEGPWRSYRERMLMIRARSWTLRDGFADVLRGLHVREEVEDATVPARMASRSAPSPRAFSLDRPRFAAPPMTAGHPAGDTDQRLTSGTPRARVADRHAMSRIDPLATVTCTVRADSGGDRSPLTDGVEAPVEHSITPVETFDLVDAEGESIKVVGVDALREALEALLDDRYLSSDQVIGVWESNAAARVIIARECGDAALAAAEARVAVAEQARRPSATQAAGGDGDIAPQACSRRPTPPGRTTQNARAGATPGPGG